MFGVVFEKRVCIVKCLAQPTRAHFLACGTSYLGTREGSMGEMGLRNQTEAGYIVFLF